MPRRHVSDAWVAPLSVSGPFRSLLGEPLIGRWLDETLMSSTTI